MKFWNCFLKLIILQSIVCLLIASSVLILKFGFNKTFEMVSEWYFNNLLVDTDIYEVIE